MTPNIIAIQPKKPLYDKAALERELRQAMNDTLAEGQRLMQEYPSAHTAYARTGTLMRSWGREVRTEGGALVGIIFSNSNIAPYNISVQGRHQGAGYKSRGWHSIIDLEKFLLKEFPARVQDAVDRAVGGK